MASRLQHKEVARRSTTPATRTTSPVAHTPQPVESAPAGAVPPAGTTIPLPLSALPPPPTVGRIEQLTHSDIREIVGDVLSERGVGVATINPSSNLKLVALTLSPEEMVEVRSLLNIVHISTSHEFLNALRRLSTVALVSADDGEEFCKVILPEDVLTRIYSRMPPDITIAEFVQEKIGDWTQMFVDGGL